MKMFLRKKLQQTFSEPRSAREIYTQKLYQLAENNPQAVVSEGNGLICLADLFDSPGIVKEEYGNWMDQQIELERQVEALVHKKKHLF